MPRITTLLILLALVVSMFTPRDPHAACYWDSDTLRTEAKGLPEAIDTIVGRFDRYPDLYYQMRLDRAAKALATNPDLLEELDDAAMASERLGKSDDAVAWLEKKHAVLERLKAAKGELDPIYKDHQYRYLANLGTTLAHRWLRDGANREKMDDLNRSRDLIAEAIALNPQAHFGREKFQLMAIEWLIAPKVTEYESLPLFVPLEDDNWLMPRTGTREQYADAEAGVRGLIVLGAAWESVDVFATYGAIHGIRGDASISYLAFLRMKELLESGKKSLAPQGESPMTIDDVLSLVAVMEKEELERFYSDARREADAWRASRNAYILERLNRGEHPDTHPDFWNAWQEPPKVAFPDGFFGRAGPEARILRLKVFGVGFVAFVISIFVLRWRWRVWRRRVHARSAASMPAA